MNKKFKIVNVKKVAIKMDKNLKLIEDYKDIKLIYEVKLKDDVSKTGLFNLKTLKCKSDNKNKVLILQTSNPDYGMPNYNISVQVFSSRLIRQKSNNEYIGFYHLIKDDRIDIDDIVNISFKDDKRFDEAPFIVEEIDDNEVSLKCLINCVPYDKIVISKNDFDFMIKERKILKYDPLDEDWFEDELDEWMMKISEE